MNILFISDFEISNIAGGMEKVIHTISREFINKGINCYEAYFQKKGLGKPSKFTKEFLIDESYKFDDIKNFISDNNIDFVITALAKKKHFVSLVPFLYKETRQLKCKIIYGYYNMPGYEVLGTISLKLAFWRLRNGYNFKEVFSLIVLTILNKLNLLSLFSGKIKKKYNAGATSDLVYVLSNSYIDKYKKLIDLSPKFIAIPNPLSYDSRAIKYDHSRKEKIVLNISRYDLVHKRQDNLLDIWKKIESNDRLKEWKLILVGYGCDEKYLKKYAEKLSLKRVEFIGACDPRSLFEKASIYAKTSAYEGLPMVLLDAMQYGVVPISVNSYSAVNDVIEDGVNGYIVEYDKKCEFVDKLTTLMMNNQIIKDMSKASIQKCSNFEKDKIMELWMKSLKNLVSN